MGNCSSNFLSCLSTLCHQRGFNTVFLQELRSGVLIQDLGYHTHSIGAVFVILQEAVEAKACDSCLYRLLTF